MNEAIGRLRVAIKTLRASLVDMNADAPRVAELLEAGVPADLANEIALLSTLVLLPEIMLIADRTGEPMARATQSYFAATETFRIDKLISAGRRINTADHYESLALSRNLQQIAGARRDIVIAALSAHPKEKRPVEAWVASDRVRVNRIGAELVTLSDSGDLTLAKTTVAAGLLGDLAHGRMI